MSHADSASDLALSLELADIADRIANRRFGAVDLVVDLKPNGSPVCDADRAIEAAVVDRLQEIHPALPIFGQEQGPAYDGAKTYWAIDPIDGTAAFIAGKTGWGFTACLVRDGEPVVAVASAPGLGRRWWASAAQGAFVRSLPYGHSTRLHVSDQDVVSRASIGWWDGYRTDTPGRTSRLDPVVAMLGGCVSAVIASGAAALSVAGGDLDAAVMRFPNPEPHHSAIFVLMVQEAGGVVTDWTGDHEMLFSNHPLHDPLLSVLRNTATPLTGG